MERFFVLTEKDFRSWVKDAVQEGLEEAAHQQSKTESHNELLISRKETAKRLNISLVTLTDWVKRGLPSHKHRRRVYFLYSEVLEYIRQNDGLVKAKELVHS